jgi:hypothetical protein
MPDFVFVSSMRSELPMTTVNFALCEQNGRKLRFLSRDSREKREVGFPVAIHKLVDCFCAPPRRRLVICHDQIRV